MTKLGKSAGKRWASAVIAAIAACAALAFAPAAAFAQEFQKVEGLPRQELPAGPFVVAAYGFIWVAVLVYVFVIARGLARVDRELGDIARKLGAKEPPR